MAVFPDAYAASLLRRDDAGRRIFFPIPEEKSCYLIPDIETERHIFRQLKRIRLVQLTAWALLPVVFITAVIVTDGVMGPKWLFLLGSIIVMLVIQLLPEWARYRLAHGLVRQADPAPAPSLLDRLPTWAIVPLIVLAFGVAFYYGWTGPLKAFVWFDDIAHFFAASKALAVVAIIGGVAAMLWGGIDALRRWFRS